MYPSRIPLFPFFHLFLHTQKKIPFSLLPKLHVRIILVLLVSCPVPLALESTQALQTARKRLLADFALAEDLDDAGLLMLLFKAALEPLVRFLAFADSVHGHGADAE